MSFDISSAQNSQVKQLIQLRKRKVREREQSFVIDGLRDLQRAIQCGMVIETLYYCPEHLDFETITALGLPRSCNPITVSPAVLDKLAYRENPEGLVARAKMREHELDTIKLSPIPFVLVAVSIEKPGNLGAILRTADAVGADAVLLASPAADPYNPNVIRASTGAVFSVPLAVAGAEAILAWLDAHQVQGVAAVPDAEQSLYQADLRGPLALFLGREQDGLSPEWEKAASLQLAIPMRGQADSLNVSVSAAVMAYEALRQRSPG